MAKRDLYSKAEFSKKSLPKNRREVFFDVFKLHFFSFVRMGLILFAFALPMLGVIFYRDYSYAQLYQNGIDNTITVIVTFVLEFALFLLLSIPVSAFGEILHEYAWLEPVFFKEDFKEGLKKNFKPTFISLFIAGLVNMALEFAYAFSPSGWLIAIPFGAGFFVLFPIVMHAIYINFIYSNAYMSNFKLGCFFYLRHLPTTFLCLILIIAPRVYGFFHFTNIIAIMTKFLVILVFFIFLLPFVLLGVQLNEMRLFDKHINIERFPELVGKGMYHEEDEEEEEA